MGLHTLIEEVEHVTVGVIDKNPELKTELRGVTFQDIFGAVHTVYHHKDGPFKDAAAVIAAFEAGVLHVFASHELAASVAKDKGEHEFAAKLDKLAAPSPHSDSTTERSDF